MRGFIGPIKFGAAAVVAAVMVLGAPKQSYAQTGHVHITVVKVALIVGGGGGSGTLTFHGRRYPLSISGIGIGSLGIARAELAGTAHNLWRAGDIAGTYSAAGAGLAIAGGGQVAQLRNARGVVLDLRGTQVGFQATLGLGGMTIALR
jgi:hypothetical protein